jgi:hypothetical protein
MSEPGVIGLQPAGSRNGRSVEVRLTVQIPRGTHIESNQPPEAFLIPTVVAVEDLERASVDYPNPIRKGLGLSDVVLSVYEGNVEFVARGEADEALERIRGSLSYQPFVNGACLPPRTLEWEAPLRREVN